MVGISWEMEEYWFKLGEGWYRASIGWESSGH